MPNNLLYLSFLLQVVQCFPGQATIDLESVDQSCNCYQSVGLDIFVEFVGSGFIQNHGVVGLILDYAEVFMSVRWSRR